MFSYRALNFYGFTLCVAALSFAVFYLERVLFLDPCPLCIFDRFVIAGIGLVFLVALAHNPRSFLARIYGLVSVLLCVTGIGLASRHIWLQRLPPEQVPACGADLYFMLDTLPLLEVIKEALTASGSCAETNWSFAGLTIPEQTLLLFLVLLGLSTTQMLRPRRPFKTVARKTAIQWY